MVHPNAKRSEEVLDTEHRWAEAHLEMNLDTIEEILSNDFRQIQQDGSFINKDQLLASYRSGERKWVVAESSDHTIQVFGDIAILQACWTGKGENAGTCFDYKARFIAVYVYEDQAWKLHLEQSIPLVQAP